MNKKDERRFMRLEIITIYNTVILSGLTGVKMLSFWGII